MNRLGINSLQIASFWMVLAMVAFAVPAQSQIVVQYTATLETGFGDGPPPSWFPTFTMNPGTVGDLTWDTANNGQPACNAVTPAVPFFGTKGSATQAIVGFGGIATVTTAGAAPRTVAFPPANNAIGLMTTCLSTQTLIPAFLTVRIQSSNLTWPGSPGSFMAGAGFAPPTASPFQFVAPWNTNQSVLASTLPGGGASPKFGGALRVNGSSNVFLGIVTPGANIFTGTLPIKLSVGAQGGPATPTFTTVTSAPFQLKGVGTPVIPGTAFQAFFPWTTGKVVGSDRAGNFWTFRSRQGFDNRNSAGTTGTLQLVTPALTDITGLAPLPFAITSVLTINFMPEPRATLLLGAGVVTLLGLYAVRRRRS
jgi:hypothetical protein